jgi:hypothetical protein
MTLRARLVKLIAALAFTCSSASAFATPMVEPARTVALAQYQHGDFVRVVCDLRKSICRVSIRIGGRRFDFGAKELSGLEPDPHGETLFYGSSERFSFRTEVVCPEASQEIEPQFRCRADATVANGKIQELRLERHQDRVMSSDLWPPLQ